MNGLETRVPPPIVAVVFAVAMWGASHRRPMATGDARWRVAAAVMFGVAAVTVAVLGVVAFSRARTTLNPVDPSLASTVVSGGIFGYTRNPMYLGLTLLLMGWAAYLGSWWALPGPAAFVAYITRFQIVPEERAMAAKFGEAYAAYRRRVRRWV